MICRFTGTSESDTVKLMFNEEFMGICGKGQVLVDTESDYKNCEITELEGEEVQTGKWSGYCFIPEEDTEEFIRTREYDFNKLNKKELEYVE